MKVKRYVSPQMLDLFYKESIDIANLISRSKPYLLLSDKHWFYDMNIPITITLPEKEKEK